MDNKYLKKIMHILHVIIDAFKRLSTALGKPIKSSPKKATNEINKGKWFKRGSSIGFTALIVFLGVAVVSVATGGPLITGDNPQLAGQVIAQNSSDSQNSTLQGENGTSSNSSSGSKPHSSTTSNSGSPSAPIQTITTAYDVTTSGPYATLTANVKDSQGNPVNGGTVDFTVDGTSADSATVNNGIATTVWKIPITWKSGSFPIVANYQGTSSYLASTGSSKLYYA